jgi:hypothetical protein
MLEPTLITPPNRKPEAVLAFFVLLLVAPLAE